MRLRLTAKQARASLAPEVETILPRSPGSGPAASKSMGQAGEIFT